MNQREALAVGVVGMGGYGATVCNQLLEHQRTGNPQVRIAGVADPTPEKFPELGGKLAAVGAKVVTRLDDLLAMPLAGVWLAVPIHLHRNFTERAVAAGKHVMVEKPAAGTVQDVDAMIAAADRAGRRVLVGFQDGYDTHLAELRRELRAGRIGRISSVHVYAGWPRWPAYYGRNNWAGHWRNGEHWVLDGPAMNALAHPLHAAMLLCGAQAHGEGRGIADVESVYAELYRAKAIETYDTCSLRAVLQGGVTLHVTLTHACSQMSTRTIVLRGDAGEVRLVGEVLAVRDPRGQQVATRSTPTRDSMPDTWAMVMRGEDDGRMLADLSTARGHVRLMNAAMDATPIVQVPPDAIYRAGPSSTSVGSECIHGIDAYVPLCGETGLTLHELGVCPWTRPGGTLKVGPDYRFVGTQAPKG